MPKPLRLKCVAAIKVVAVDSTFSANHGDRMYRSKNGQQTEFPDFYLPFSGHLDPENRWIALARLVPWELAEEIYHANLCEDSGAPIVPARVALGALLVKERLGLTDRETFETIQENPYLQFLIGCEEFSQDRPFDASLMVDFRKRFGEEGIGRMGEAIALASLQETEAAAEPTDDHPRCHLCASRHSLSDRRQLAQRGAREDRRDH